jgi:GAF domain
VVSSKALRDRRASSSSLIVERRRQIVTRVLDGVTTEFDLQRLCEICADVADVGGAGILLMSDHAPRRSAPTTNSVTALINELQVGFDEGPGADAHRFGRDVLEPDLDALPSGRWSAFQGPARDAGVRAVFGFPVRVGAVRLGALSLHSDRAGQLSDDQRINASVIASLAAQAILCLEANLPPAELAGELLVSAAHQMAVHQAAGMIAVQLDVSVGQALVHMRAHAFAHRRTLIDVAQEVVDGRLRFDDARVGTRLLAPLFGA